MPHNVDLIFTLTGGLVAALFLGLLARRLGVAPIVGYLAAGVVVGPFTPGFVAHAEIAEQLAELGVVLLMFGVGLHFHARDLLKVRAVALPGAAAQITVAAGLGALVARWLGWSLVAGAVFGVAISVASTVVLTRVLDDNGLLHTPAGHLAVGWLIVEDLFTVVVLVVMPALGGATGPAGLLGALLVALLKLAALVGFTAVVGRRLLPWLLTRVALTRSRELFTLAVLAIALGIAVGSAVVFGASMALGAFLAGMVVGQSVFSTRAAAEALPMRDAFAVLFFVSVGMLFDPAALRGNAPAIAATAAIVLVAKPATAYAVVRLLRRPRRTALTAGFALGQIGEFSFIVATLGSSLGLLPPSALQILVAVAIISIAANPIVFRALPWLAARLGEPAAGGAEGDVPADEPHAIVVGYGPVGRTLTHLLREGGITPTVIELNLETYRRLRREGVRALYGDAAQLEVLEQSGVKTAGGLIFAASGTPADAVIRAARELNPGLRVIARATYLGETAAARDAGADVVVTAEAEVALAMAEALLAQLGATGERIDRARDELRGKIAEAI
ncbi:MAG TPA: cation:proton antiporter [Polyangiaceae bacterium]|nr:cation:proton antiporter [Polyangiaceae bacterium]